MNLRFRFRAIAFAAMLAAAPAASAQIFRAYLAIDGNDANPCTLQQPCRLLPAALAAVASGGEIWMLDSANYNTGNVNVTKSVSILAVPGVVGSLVGNNANALTINGTGIEVSLRNLSIAPLAGSAGIDGIRFTQGAVLRVSDCGISGMAFYAIYANAAGGRVVVADTRVLGTFGIAAASGVTLTVARSRLDGANFGVLASGGAFVHVSDSVFIGGASGAFAYNATAQTTARLIVERSSFSGAGIRAETGAASAFVAVTATQNVIGDAAAAIEVVQAASSTASVVAEGNTMTHNGYGFNFTNGTGTIFSRGNNTLMHNNTNVGGGGVLTPLAGM